MGLMKWESTHGVKQDRASALHLLKLAAAQGHIEAKRLCEDFQPKLNAAIPAAAEEKASKTSSKTRSRKSKTEAALEQKFDLAYAYYKGTQGHEKNGGKALSLFQEAAEEVTLRVHVPPHLTCGGLHDIVIPCLHS
jgi:TPR repeat protein